jgi:hypothetical protein
MYQETTRQQGVIMDSKCLDDLCTARVNIKHIFPVSAPCVLRSIRYSTANDFYFYYLRHIVLPDGTSVWMKRAKKYSRSRYGQRLTAQQCFYRFCDIFGYERYCAKIHKHLLQPTKTPCRHVWIVMHTMVFTLQITFCTWFRCYFTWFSTISSLLYNHAIKTTNSLPSI